MAGFNWNSQAGGDQAGGDTEQRLDRLFQDYGNAVSVPDPSANFSANVWQAIEARRSNRVFGLWAKLVTSGALAASLVLGVMSSIPPKSPEPEYLAVYIEQPLQTSEPAEMLRAIVDSSDR